MNKLAVNIGDAFNSPFGRGGVGVGSLVSTLVSNAFVLAGIILLFMLVFGGIGILSGAGSNDPERAAKGKQAATSAVIGFIIIFASYWIIQIIEQVTGVGILSPTFK